MAQNAIDQQHVQDQRADDAKTLAASSPKQRTSKANKQRTRSTGKAGQAGGRPSDSKTEIVLKKLRQSRGATIPMLMEATSWQAHSVRGFLSAVVRKRLGLSLVSEVSKDGVRRYRIDGNTGTVA